MRSSCAPGIRPADFARLCGTNKRTLLHYDEIGLFCPALRDDRGFRYYDESQCDVFMVIRSLRDLGMSLAEIKDYLDERTPDSLEALLRHQQQRVSQELARLERIQRMLRTKQNLLREGRQAGAGQVVFLPQPEEWLVLSRPIDSSDPAVARRALYAHLADCYGRGLEDGYPFGAMMRSEDLARGRFGRYAYYFTKLSRRQEGAELFCKPAGLYAVIYLQGDYHRAEDAFQALLGAAGQKGLTACGYAYKEGILDEIAQKDPEKHLTKISVAVK